MSSEELPGLPREFEKAHAAVAIPALMVSSVDCNMRQQFFALLSQQFTLGASGPG